MTECQIDRLQDKEMKLTGGFPNMSETQKQREAAFTNSAADSLDVSVNVYQNRSAFLQLLYDIQAERVVLVTFRSLEWL